VSSKQKLEHFIEGTGSHRRQKATGVSDKGAHGTNAMPKYQKGDYLRVELLSGVAGTSMSIWMYVDHCDDKHAIVFGTIDTEPSERLGNSLKSGTKVAVGYCQLREHREHRQSW
jgi:hypothetical protein